MKLYFEMYSGISGDMTIGALLDLGASREKLENAIKSLNITGYELIFSRTKKNGIDAYNFDVELHNHPDEEHHHHDEYEHHHDHHHHHHNHHHHEHSHEHRNLKDVYEIIDRGDFNDNIKNNAKKIFDIIANSESKAHNIDKNEVHFHEVGAIDSIIDIVGVSVLLDDLNVEEIYFSDLYDGKGYQKCAHGMMPVPVPAVLNIVNAHNLKLNIIDDMGEHITPTGAAIVANFNRGYKLEDFTIKKIGLGAGNKDFANTTNILRVMEIETDKKKQ
ncbi:PF01969 family protein [Peptoanaerobacter stomatis]|jgi:hypothetical protein|uniref:PF01969 family protein n=1 Tax=Peptoanaerobacter stomatis TaxID=796937 RepID=J6HA67_9FIRM|nr:LarC family nickel insertion protein [Peptoanaerobacter stomatis]EJU19763.1 PF01969 family protein [Peptoanaerobacter stomatis]NWO24644.1 LarC family nickel insertion protein [Peptostreptococcaceae bacterium oral taxon 081]